ncbi:DUF4351 domain-containing protein [Clostridium sp. UBA5988]
MSSIKSKSEITLESIEIANEIKSYTDKNKCLTLLYALFDKFGDELSKKRFKEVVGMTEVGKMIYNEGKEKGKSELLIKQLIKKFGILPDEYKEKIRNLSEAAIENIGTEIFDMESLEELKKYI